MIDAIFLFGAIITYWERTPGYLVLNYIQGFISLAIIFLFLMWVYHSSKNLLYVNSGGQKYSPPAAVIWWLVPVASLFMPILVMREIWQASNPQADPADILSWQQIPISRWANSLLGSWWLAFIIPQTLSFVRVYGFSGTYVHNFLSLEAAILAIFIVKKIDDNQLKKYLKVSRMALMGGEAGKPLTRISGNVPLWTTEGKLIAPDSGKFSTQGFNAARARPESLLWKFATPGEISTDLAMSGNTIYFGSSDGYLNAVDVPSGKQLWRFGTKTGHGHDQNPISSPSVASGLVCFCGADDNIYALDAVTGKYIWHFKINMGVLPSPLAIDDMVYFGSGDKCMYALDLKTGQSIWKIKVGGFVDSKPLLYQGSLIFGAFDKRLRALDARDGREQWQIKGRGKIDATPLIFDDRLFYVSYDHSLHAIDLGSREELWAFLARGLFSSQPAISGNTVLCGNYDGTFYAIDADTGLKKWTFLTGDSIMSSPAIQADIVFFGSCDNSLYALDINEGEQLWSFKADGWIVTSPLVADGRLIFGSNDGNLYALNI